MVILNFFHINQIHRKDLEQNKFYVWQYGTMYDKGVYIQNYKYKVPINFKSGIVRIKFIYYIEILKIYTKTII